MNSNNVNISINQLVDFSTATDAKKRRIIKDQKSPNTFRIGWYQTPRACIKKAIVKNGDIDPILDGVKRLKKRIIKKPQQSINRDVSLEAMKRFLNIKLPSIFKNHNCTAIKERIVKSTFIDDVEIIVSPDVIYEVKLNNRLYLGAVKLHISKGNIFDIEKSKIVSSVLFKYMNELAENYNAEVLPELCFSIDIFGEKVVSNSSIDTNSTFVIENLCSEIKRMWYSVA